MVRRLGMNFLLMEVCLLIPILIENDASNMDKVIRTKAVDLSLIEVELRTKIKSHLEFYKEVKVCCMLRYYIFIIILLNCHLFMSDSNHL